MAFLFDFLIGSVVGIVLALSGSGGALISIPLMMYHFQSSLSVASVLSMPVVFVAAFVMLFFQRQFVQYRLLVYFFPSLILSSFFVSQFRSFVPEWFILLLICFLMFWGLFQVFKKESECSFCRLIPPVILYFFLGALSGALTTLTGLGGGVILVPVLKKYVGLDLRSAVSTSLAIVFLSLLISMVFLYFHHQFVFLPQDAFLAIFLGFLFSLLLFRLVFLKFSFSIQTSIQRFTYLLVVLISSYFFITKFLS